MKRCANQISRDTYCGKPIREDDEDALNDLCGQCVNAILFPPRETDDLRDANGRYFDKQRKATTRSGFGWRSKKL